MKKKKKLKKANILVALLLFIFIISIAILSVARSDIFIVKNIKVKNNEILGDKKIIELSKIKLGKNLFEYDLKEIKRNIEKSNYIDKVDVGRNLFNTIEIDVDEKNIAAILVKDDSYYFIDEKLEYIDEVYDKSMVSEYLKVSIDFDIKDNKIYYKNKNDFNYLKLLITSLADEGVDNRVKEIGFLQKENIRIKLDERLTVLMLKDDNIEKNINRLSKVLVDLQSRDEFTGNIDMTYKKYILYTY